MNPGRIVALVLALSVGPVGKALGGGPDEPGASSPPLADFKVEIASYALGKEPLDTAELFVRKRKAYYIASGRHLEAIILDPSAARLELIDLDRKLRTEVSLKSLDAFQARLHGAIEDASTRREGQGGRANELAAAMSRDLVDPRFDATFDAAKQHLRLVNPTVEVEATGIPESDPARLGLIADSLGALAKLGALRDPRAIPPFARLEATRILATGHRLRPTEMSFLYRLSGPPAKFRWTYRLVPSLTDREVEALARIDAVHRRCRYARFDRYEKPEGR